MKRSSWLVESGADALSEALDARFVREVSNGTIGVQSYANYLEIEESFVASACRLHGLAVWQAPSWAAMQRHARAVHGLTTEQSQYFRTARAAWPVAARMDDAARRRADRLSEFALSAAEIGGYPAVVTVMFAAEHLYRTWCSRAVAAPAGPIADWVALHTRAPFTTQVDALAAEVDDLPRSVPDEQLHEWFTGMLGAEIHFHDAIY
ncbi:TenA family protein [Saccharopolyspora sp. K220]|uniref:TenA family protein n=1 Tax=Saccharopolyspora soli TaxID=2926618 RepID=UPI001F5A44F0|nr:TenA family protein [Saccharopolyspora soli]MCI2421656.1 TenA family protein [Saccharopolyspora soli]